MSTPVPPPDRVIFTIGHSNQTSDDFVALLGVHAIEVVVDVRSRPYSRYAPQFNSDQLKASLPAAGVKYLFLGKELGGRPDSLDYYDAEGYVLYDRVARAPFFLAGLARLETGMQRYRVAMMCSEEDPAGCHRHLLIARVLEGRGIAVRHIRGDGRLQTPADLAAAAAPPETTAGQLTLFPVEEITVWRSLRSVLRKEPPPTSSAP